VHGPRASCARSPSIQACALLVSRVLKLSTAQSHSGEASRANLSALTGLTAVALCLCFYKTLYTGHLQSGTRVHARRDARVRVSSTDVLFADSVHGEKRNRFLVTFCRSAKSYPLAAGQRKLLPHLQIGRHQPSPFRNARQHPRPNLFAVMKRENKIRKPLAHQCAMRPHVPFLAPANSKKRPKQRPGFD